MLMHNAIIQVHHNEHLILPGKNDWAFGQVLPIVMIAFSLREMLKLLPYLLKRYGMKLQLRLGLLVPT